MKKSTGLKDKNGKEIYEGDILKGMRTLGSAGSAIIIAAVLWDGIKGYQLESWDINTVEVIGNVSGK